MLNVGYMDNLRALAMLVGVVFHASLAYSPLLSDLWLASDPQTSVKIDIVAFFSHLFRMPLFFVVAGFFTLMMFEKRGIKGLLKNRGKRIVLPFVIFMPLVLVSVMMGIFWALENVENQPAMLKFIGTMGDNPQAEQPPFSTMHLWFLFNLTWFYLVAAGLYKFNWHQSKWLGKLMNPAFVLLILPLVMVPAMVTQAVPHPGAERIYPELWSLGFYGIFFLFGFAVFQHQQLLQSLERYTAVLLITSIVGYGIYFWLMPETFTLEDMVNFAATGGTLSFEHIVQVVLGCYIAVHMTIVCLVAGKKWLDTEFKSFRYFADSSYWVYIIHMPLIFIIQFLLLDVHLNLWVEFLICTLVTLFIGILSYALLVRNTPLGTLLNGQRKPMFKV